MTIPPGSVRLQPVVGIFSMGIWKQAPPSIDTRAGTDTTEDSTYNCGFVRAIEEPNGIGTGACYFDPEDGRPCENGISGKKCLELGGVLVAGEQCLNGPPASVDFTLKNAYYVWPDTRNNGRLPAPDGCDSSGAGCANIKCPPLDSKSKPPLSREYMTIAQTQGGIKWWNEQQGPRMLTVSYNAIHTPYQQPPDDLVAGLVEPDFNDLACQGTGDSVDLDKRQVANAMFEAMDKEVGRMLDELGLATLHDGGTIDTLKLNEENTMLVIIGDNGTFAPIVKFPFDPFHSKGTVYQTGVWVPLIVAGPLVQGTPGREVNALINSVDLFQLFGEIAGLNVRELVPPAHRLDSQPMLPYLTNPNQSPIREFNFTQIGYSGIIATPVDQENRLWPCVLDTKVIGDPPMLEGGVCFDLLFDKEELCEENGGMWFGPPEATILNPNAQEQGLPDGAWNSCCDIVESLSDANDPVSIAALDQWAVRNIEFKLIEKEFSNCGEPTNDPKMFPPFETTTSFEFYDLGVSEVDFLFTEICAIIDKDKCNDGGSSLALPDGNPCGNAPECFGPLNELKETYSSLMSELEMTKNSGIDCPGDGNLDKRVNDLDLIGVNNFMDAGPSYFDFNKDGLTNQEDQAIVIANLKNDCLGACLRADLNHDNRVNSKDIDILDQSLGPCNIQIAAEINLCAADLNFDGVINTEDLNIMQATREEFSDQPCPVPGG